MLRKELSYILLIGLGIAQLTSGALKQNDEDLYLKNFNAINTASYAAVDDSSRSDLPEGLSSCKNKGQNFQIGASINIEDNDTGLVYASQLKSICQEDKLCIIPENVTLIMNDSLNVGALSVQGSVKWSDEMSLENSYLCAGYVAIKGSWDMRLESKSAWIYIKDNGASHPMLRTRSFGTMGENAILRIEGRKLQRTWSLLSNSLERGDQKMELLHNPALMGWRVGDRIAVAPTKRLAQGIAAEFRINNMEADGTIELDGLVQDSYEANFAPPIIGGEQPTLMSAEVVNLDRNIVVTGDDFTEVICDPNLPEAITGEETSIGGCRCSSFRKKCTVGLHTMVHSSKRAQIRNIRVEKCGQRGIEGKYCLHFHKSGDCPDCVFENNAVENSHQRGIIVHGTHRSQVISNVVYNVRGAGIYIEDGNEMHNFINYNVAICKFPFDDATYHGCTIPGTSNRIADTSDNQSGIFSRSSTNNLIGNRVANNFNGMLFRANERGRGDSLDRVCEADGEIGRIEGNTFHGNGRFGTYTLGYNYPKVTNRSILTDGQNDLSDPLCYGFDGEGNTRGAPVAFENNMDYGNAFVGHYEAGDIQYGGHQSYNNNNNMYWKETKNFENGCSAHITGGHFATGNIALPDVGTFIIENASFGDDTEFEANHHCNVGVTGLLCMPQYILHQVKWKSVSKKVSFQSNNAQAHDANQNHGGIFSLSPSDAALVMDGVEIDGSFLPPGFVSLVSNKFSYLLETPGNVCQLSNSKQYDNGILCKVPLRALRIYSRGLTSQNAPELQVEAFFKKGGISAQTGEAASSTSIRFHQIGRDNQTNKQGYSLPVIPGTDHSYRLSLKKEVGNIPSDWVVEFSDVVMGNRWSIEYIHLNLVGRDCGVNGLVSSHHDRKFIWSGDDFMDDKAWGNHGACTSAEDVIKIDCATQNEGIMSGAHCPELCSENCPEEKSFCDCGSKTCVCKPGFFGPECEFDICEAARCGEHGSCAARYLGGAPTLPVTSEQACICDPGWTGPLCTFNPSCPEKEGKICSDNGQCVATGIDTAVCKCNLGFSGESCETSCDNICKGDYPFGCASNIDGVIKFGCSSSGGCSYARDNSDLPPGFCAYKTSDSGPSLCTCKASDCEIPGECNDGQCSSPKPMEDGTPCNSVPFGICKLGKCTNDETDPIPSTPPITLPTPSTPPIIPPASSAFRCGCKSCTEEVLETMAGSHSCGDRIDWLKSPSGGSMTEEEACIQIGKDEFKAECQLCDPTSCNDTNPLTPPIITCDCPVANDCELPGECNADGQCSQLSPKEDGSPCDSVPNGICKQGICHASPCGCNLCTEDVLRAMAGGYSCGDRIMYLQSPAGGSMSEEEACTQVAKKEFNADCGRCDPSLCD